MFEVVYVHGFGKQPDEPEFSKKIKRFLINQSIDFEIFNYHWDSSSIELKYLPRNWLFAKKLAEKESSNFSYFIRKREEKGIPYYIVAFSLGTSVVLKGLNQLQMKLMHLRGIFFMGAAIPNNSTLKSGILPNKTKIINYHSKWDNVLSRLYRGIEPEDPGGLVGFSDMSIFENYNVKCGHVKLITYDKILEPIAYLILANQGIFIKGFLLPKLKVRTLGGKTFWNDVIKIGKYLIQQNSIFGYYRGIDLEDNYRRVFLSRNLHTIIQNI